jgi:hypothetical protein
MSLNARKAHPTTYDFQAYKEWREQDDERQKEALRKFYARNAAPHYTQLTRKQLSWAFAKIAFWAVVVYALVALGFAL